MSMTYTVVASSALACAGLVGTVWALRPAPPSLDSVRVQLSAPPLAPGETSVTPTTTAHWWAPALARLSTMTVSVTDEDLELCGISRTAHTVKKLMTTAVLLALGPVVSLLAWALSLPMPIAIPTGVTLILACFSWLISDFGIREKASALRAEMQRAVAIYLQWVAQERSAGQGAASALREASKISTSWCFTHIRDTIRASELAREEPWAGLRRIGMRYHIPALCTLATVMDSADDGAAIYQTLITEAEAHEEAQANLALTTAKNRGKALQSTPPVLMAIGGLSLIFIPLITTAH